METSEFISSPRKIIQNAIIIGFSMVLMGVIFLVDCWVPKGIAIGVLYSFVILLSWLMPGKLISAYVAILATFLIILAGIFSNSQEGDLAIGNFNRVLSCIVVWLCAILVSMAKNSFGQLSVANKNLEAQIMLVNEKSEELNLTIIELRNEQERRKIKEQELIRSNAALKQKNEELEQFLYIASHDLQEPLQTIINFSNLLNEEYLNVMDETGEKSLHFITASSLRLQKQITGLLHYSRVGQDGRQVLIKLNEFVGNILTDLHVLIEQADAEIRVGDLPEIVGSPTDLRLVFQNLISNALKFRRDDVVPTVEISVKEQESQWVFEVKDNGIGIDPKHYNKVFTIFKRVHPKSKFDGTGLGLAFCKKAIEAHGGKIWVESSPNAGSSFKFTLVKKEEGYGTQEEN